MKKILIFIVCMILSGMFFAHAEKQYNAERICDAIYIIEGGEKANQLYGINPKYVTCNSECECRQICINTVNNKFQEWHKQNEEKHFLVYLAKKYCPPNWEVWLKNLKFYLKKGE